MSFVELVCSNPEGSTHCLHTFVDCQELSNCVRALDVDESVQKAFLKRHLARQPTLSFNKTRKLLHMSKLAKKHKKLISLEDAAPAVVMPTVATDGKRRRSRYKPARRQPAGRPCVQTLSCLDILPFSVFVKMVNFKHGPCCHTAQLLTSGSFLSCTRSTASGHSAPPQAKVFTSLTVDNAWSTSR